MKKLLCAALTLMMIVMMAAISVPAAQAAADNGVLTVTVNGENPVKIDVGKEFIVRVGLNAGSKRILNGQVHMEYDPGYLSFIPKTAYVAAWESEAVEGYSFSPAIVNSSIVMNYGTEGIVNYNFTKPNGITAFNDTSKLFARFRFKATAAGTTDITHLIQYMVNVDEERIYYAGKPNTAINPYMVFTIQPATICVGDANNDNGISVLDAIYMQRIAAGADLSYDITKADVTEDGVVSLKDAIIVRRYLAGKTVQSDIGKWLFPDDQ